MGRGSGFGKVILFGEHFVVYGAPGIVSAINLTADAEVKRTGDEITIKDERRGTKGYTQKKREQQKESIQRMLNAMGINSKRAPLEIVLGGNLPSFSGVGASAASSVAIARAIADELGMKFTDERTNEVAYEAEKAYAGTPSGIDNSAATYGGLIWFRKSLSGGPNAIEEIRVKQPIEIVIGNTRVVADTKEMVAGVAERRRKSPERYNRIFDQAEWLVLEAKKALTDFDLEKVGRLMSQNQDLLQEIGVSCKELDYLINLAQEYGALGAKLTGGGGGGCMVALTPGKKLQEVIATAMEKAGFNVLRAKIGT